MFNAISRPRHPLCDNPFLIAPILDKHQAFHRTRSDWDRQNQRSESGCEKSQRKVRNQPTWLLRKPRPRSYRRSPDLTFTAKSTADELEKVIKVAKGIRPASAEQYSAMQTAIRDASKQLMATVKDKELPRYKQAQLDSMSASLALATFFWR